MTFYSSIVITALAIRSVAAIGVDNVDVPNSTISCNWAGAGDLVEDIISHELNVTDIVAQCAGVCELAFASRAPDIAGQGVRIGVILKH
jgi:hypothetical protein